MLLTFPVSLLGVVPPPRHRTLEVGGSTPLGSTSIRHLSALSSTTVPGCPAPRASGDDVAATLILAVPSFANPGAM